MYLSDKLRNQLRDAIQHHFDAPKEIILFGSSVNPDSRGGDIDIALSSHYDRSQFRQRKAALLAALLQQDIELPLDLLQLQARCW
ncbi:hypothetical protein D5085_03880 [Ectothiorhodospiraceae bacterium BW-2]|nr:hypothetical protein D5085_03880 [Ectothiorhodospiraceae bacterium BW-2]